MLLTHVSKKELVYREYKNGVKKALAGLDTYLLRHLHNYMVKRASYDDMQELKAKLNLQLAINCHIDKSYARILTDNDDVLYIHLGDVNYSGHHIFVITEAYIALYKSKYDSIRFSHQEKDLLFFMEYASGRKIFPIHIICNKELKDLDTVVNKINVLSKGLEEYYKDIKIRRRNKSKLSLITKGIIGKE